MGTNAQYVNNLDYCGPASAVKQMKERNNALVMNYRIMSILSDRDKAIQERDNALSEKRKALAERDEAIQLRDKAVSERDQALSERDSALSVLQFYENSQNTHGTLAIDALPISSVPADNTRLKKPKYSKRVLSKSVKSGKKDSNRKVGEAPKRVFDSTSARKYRVEWDDITKNGLNLISFDDMRMPLPVCSCTGTAHQCYRWGKCGWQSCCCTTTLSQYPLPHNPNKRHSRIGGRKMSGNVFNRLLSRLAAKGHDLSTPVDLKDYWARHGTNRYIIIQ